MATYVAKNVFLGRRLSIVAELHSLATSQHEIVNPELSPTARWLRERAAYHRERARTETDPARAERHRDIASILEEEAARIEEEGGSDR